MTKRMAEGILEGLDDALAYIRGDKSRGKAHVVRVDDVDVAKTRQSLHLTQSEFAELFAVPLPTVQNWEQGRRRPEGPARVLLQVINEEPDAVFRAVRKLPRAGAKKVSKLGKNVRRAASGR